MRTIKFRSFGKSGMLYAELTGPENISKMLYVFRNGELEQFTGQVDKNGKEIYEGDIVTIHTPELKIKTWTGTVKYGEHWLFAEGGQSGCLALGFYIADPEDPTSFIGSSLELDFFKDVEVSGNIHNNIEVL